MPPHSEINAKGFWESYDIASLNDALLSSHQSRWDDVLSIPVDGSDQQSSLDFESKATELLERDFSDTDLFVLKDPRICRLLPYWLRVFKHLSIEPRVVIPVRHPLEVAASLKRRDKFQKEKAIYLWLRHLVDAERASRNVPRSFLLYDDMLENWRATVDKLSSDLDIRWPIAPDSVKHEAGTFLDVQLRHHRSSTFRQNSDDLISNLAKDLYSKLQSGDHDISSLVDSIHAGLYPSEKLLAPILQDISGRYENSVHLLGETKQLAAQLESNFISAQSLLTERDNELANTRRHFDTLSAEFEAKCQHVNQLVGEAAQLQKALVTTQSVLDVRDNELHTARQHFHQLNTEFEAKCQHVNQLTDEASRLKETLATTQSLLDTRDGELANTRQHFDTLSAEFEAKCQHVNQLIGEAAQLQEALVTTQSVLDVRDNELNTARQHLHQLNAEFEAKCQHVNQLTDEASRLKEALAATQSVLDTRDGELASTRQHFDALSVEFEAKCQHVNQLTDEASQLKVTLAATQSALDTRDNELANTRQHFDALSVEFEAKCQHVNQLAGEAAQLRETLANTQSALDVRDIELSNTQLVLTVADSSIAALHAEKEDAVAHLHAISDGIRNAIFQTDRTNTGRTFMSQQAEHNQSMQSALEALQSQTDGIVALSQVNNTLLQGSTDKLIEADRAIRNLIAPQLKKSILRAFFRKRNKNAQLLQNSPLFDAAFYVSSHAEALASELTPYEHYLTIGASKGWDPHPVFSTSWYLEQNRDVAQSGMNPLVHFLRNGAKEGRSPHPLFDMALYLKTYPKVASSGMNSLEHYLRVGAQAGARPHALFDGNAYMDSYPEVRAMGMNPLVHYLQFGHLRNYRPHWSFDPVYYLIDNPAVAGMGIPPLVHFITKGAKQRRNPSAEFDTAGFIAQYPFLEHSNENPLAYYVSNVYPKGAPIPAAPKREQAAVAPTTPIHNEETGQPLPAFMDFLWDEFGDPIRMDIVTRMQRFHLPFTSDKITPKPSAQEIETWLGEIASMSEAMGDLARPDVTIVVPVYNQLAFTLACIHSVLSSKTRYSYEIIVADDRSTDRTTEIFSHGVGRIRHVLSEQNQGFIRNCNSAAKQAKGRYLVLLNNDTIVMPGWLDELIEPLDKHPDIGLVGSKLLYPDGRLQESGGIIFGDGSGWNYGRMDDPRKPQYCYMRDSDYVSGASIALRTDFWHDQGGFDELYSVAYYEDTDMAFRVRKAGLRVVVQPLSQLLHFEGISSGTDTSSGAKQYQITNGAIFRDKWSNALADHPLCDPDRLPVNRTSRGRVLVIDACTPTPDRDSGSMDTFQYLRILKSFGLHVTFVPDNLAHFGRYTQDLQRIGVETLYAPYWMTHEEVFTKLGSTFDLILIYRVSIASRLLKLVRSHAPQAKLIFDTVDLHFLREEREAELTGDPEKVLSAANTRKTELNVISKADATIILSNHEMEVVHKLLPKAKLYEIPIVREIPGRGSLGFAERNDIVFIGGFRHAPNLDAVKWFVSEVWPILRSKGFTGNFQIVGSDMPPEITALHGSGIIIRGHVPVIDDVFHSVRLSIAPLRYGAGLKGKVISSLSFGVPVVATSVAVEGGGFVHQQHVKVADEPEAFADAIIRVYENQQIWENLSINGLQHCDQSFSVSAVSAKLHDMINDISPELIHGK